MPTETAPSKVRGTAPTRTVRAVIQNRYGSADSLTTSTIDTPAIAADEVLIEVVAAGVDRGVWHLVTGRPYLVRLAGYGITKPKNPVPGLDVSGRVIAVGDDVRRFRVGDEVFGIANGSYAELAAAKEDKLAHKPTGLSFEQAAVAAISGITALQALTDVGDVQAGQSVLVIGASGGVGTYAVQLGKALGATVTGVASASKTDLVSSLGADEVIDYAAGDYLDGEARYDLIVDIGGLNSVTRLRRALTKNGTLVIVGGEGGGSVTGGIGRQLRAKMLSPFVSQRLTFFLSAEHHSHIERLARFMEAGDVTPAVGRRYRLEGAPEAIADLEGGRARGKSVIVVGKGS
ncbi:MAG: NAD(P)-dependent alcohol dehydrogenase [Acidimicrobiia bacterium]